MAKRNPRLKLFIRLDGNGQAIPGSVVERLKQPRQGRWKEIISDACCDGTTLAATPSATSGTSATVVIKCDSTTKITVIAAGTISDIDTLEDVLNKTAGYLGVFEESGGDINLVLKSGIVQDLACAGTLSMTITVA
jgi:hypothetical protein